MAHSKRRKTEKLFRLKIELAVHCINIHTNTQLRIPQNAKERKKNANALKNVWCLMTQPKLMPKCYFIVCIHT